MFIYVSIPILREEKQIRYDQQYRREGSGAEWKELTSLENVLPASLLGRHSNALGQTLNISNCSRVPE